MSERNDIADFIKLLRSAAADDLLVRASRIIEGQQFRIDELCEQLKQLNRQDTKK